LPSSFFCNVRFTGKARPSGKSYSIKELRRAADRTKKIVTVESRAVKAGADVIAPNGKPFTADSIGMALATRNLMDSLRSAGEITGGPRPFAPRDRSEFLSALDRAIVRLMRAGFG
jgi:Uncharacterized BCR, YaiI/YqxD family COG1671